MAMSLYYVDPASGNDTTGDGTIGTPWKSVQKALDTITRNSTDGDQINVKAGAADVLTAGLSLSTYGTPSAAAPLVFRGYTAAANDGGIGEIDGAATYSIYDSSANSNKDFVHFWDMKIGNSGSAQIVNLYRWSSLVNCEVHTSTHATAVYFRNAINRAVGCLFRNLKGSENVRDDGGTHFINCVFADITGTYALSSASTLVVLNCLFDLDTDTSISVIRCDQAMTVAGCTFYTNAANTGQAIHQIGASGLATLINNVIVGNSGVNGKGINTAAVLVAHGGNAYYNNTTNESVTGKAAYQLKDPITLSGAPFVDAANDDFNLATGSEALGAAWPAAFKGYPATTNAADIGAVQRGAGSGGGIIRRIARILGA